MKALTPFMITLVFSGFGLALSQSAIAEGTLCTVTNQLQLVLVDGAFSGLAEAVDVSGDKAVIRNAWFPAGSFFRDWVSFNESHAAFPEKHDFAFIDLTTPLGMKAPISLELIRGRLSELAPVATEGDPECLMIDHLALDVKEIKDSRVSLPTPVPSPPSE